MQDTIAHNTQLTQQNWGLTSAMQYDISNIFLHMGLCLLYTSDAADD